MVHLCQGMYFTKRCIKRRVGATDIHLYLTTCMHASNRASCEEGGAIIAHRMSCMLRPGSKPASSQTPSPASCKVRGTHSAAEEQLSYLTNAKYAQNKHSASSGQAKPSQHCRRCCSVDHTAPDMRSSLRNAVRAPRIARMDSADLLEVLQWCSAATTFQCCCATRHSAEASLLGHSLCLLELGPPEHHA